MLTGENGILTQAQRAKNETENAAQNEANILNSYEDYLNNATGDVPQVNDSNPGVLEGNGTEQNPYTINSIEDLVSFADSVTNGNTYQEQYGKLSQSLDFKSDKSYMDPNRENYYGYTGKLKEALTTGEGFKPIGTTIMKEDDSDKSNSFCGVFDGNGKQIINCYINENVNNSENKIDLGLFGGYLYGELKNLGLLEIDYNLSANGQRVSISGISGRLFNKITNCYVTGNITAIQDGDNDTYCVGLVAFNKGIIENSYNLANISLTATNENSKAYYYCSGIVANNESEIAKIEKCHNSGQLTANVNSCTSTQIGGIVRTQTLGEISNCYNTGNINFTINGSVVNDCILGGIVGISYRR